MIADFFRLFCCRAESSNMDLTCGALLISFCSSYAHCSWFAVSGIPTAKTSRATAAAAPNVKKVTAYPK